MDVAAINRIADALETTRDQEQTDDDKRAFRENITIGLLISTVIVTAIADVIFYLTMDDAHRNSEKQITKMEESAQLTRDSNEINKRAMEASTRAWVGTSTASLVGQIQTGKPVIINITASNTGREPAINFSYDPNPRTLTGPETTIFDMDMRDFVAKCFASPAKPDAQVLYPSSGFGAGNFDFQTTFPAEKITPDVISGNTILVIQGCMTYVTFGQTKHSAFCYLYKNGTTKPDRLNICQGGFRAD